MRELAIILRAKDLASKTIRGTTGDLKNLNSVAGRAGKGIGTTALNVARLGAAAAGAAGGGLILAVKAASDFEAQLNTINTIARATPPELKSIGDGVRQIARDTGTPLADLTQGYYDLLSAGIKTADAQGVLTAANTLAIGGLSTTAESVDLLTTALNVYGGGAAEATKYTDIFAKTIERGKVTAADLAGSFSQVGSIAKASGVSLEELGAAYARLTASGVPAAQAATEIRSALVALTKVTGPLDKLQKQTGRNYLSIAGKQGLVAALEIMRKDAAKAGVPIVDLLGRVEGLNFTLATTGPNFAAYNADLAAMGKANGTAAGQMAERQQGLNFQLGRLKALARDAGITIGNALLPKLTPLVAKLNDFVNLNQDKIAAFGEAIAGGFEQAAKFAQRIPWEAVGSGLKTAATWGQKLMDVFLSMPPEAQATIVALAGLNKLSGGAVTGIVGELGKGLIKGILGMNAGVVNINAGVVNGAGGAPVPGGGGITGIVKSVLKAGAGLGLGFVGANVLAGGVQQGGPIGAAQGAAGAAGMIGGGALAFGPLGAAAASLLAAAQTFQQVNAASSSQASGLKTQADVWIQQSPSLNDLKTGLAAVDAGIAQIRSNPLNVLVSGDALAKLEAIRTNTINEITKLQDSTVRTVAASERAESRMTSAQLATAAATRDVRSTVEANRIATAGAAARASINSASLRDRIEANRIATAVGAAKTASAAAAAGAVARAGGLAAAAAVRAKDLSVKVTVPVTTQVSVRSVIGAETILRNYSRTKLVAI